MTELKMPCNRAPLNERDTLRLQRQNIATTIGCYIQHIARGEPPGWREDWEPSQPIARVSELTSSLFGMYCSAVGLEYDVLLEKTREILERQFMVVVRGDEVYLDLAAIEYYEDPENEWDRQLAAMRALEKELKLLDL